jgi:hypothetical protein
LYLRSIPSRPTILPSHSNGYNIDPSDRVIRRNGEIPSVDSNEKIHTESLLKQKMCSSKKYNHTSLRGTFPSDPANSQSLQKPRVYTYDDRNLPIQQENILSSSSESSTLSTKDKTIKEVGETR